MISVRLAGHSDVPAIVTLLDACVSAMRAEGIEQWDHVYPTEEILRQDILSTSLYLGSTGPQPLAGVVVLNEHQDPEYVEVPWTLTDGRVAVVHRLMVNPALQGQGIARALMQFVERRAAEIGYDTLRLDAFTLNPRAIALYRGLGYQDAGAMKLRKGWFRGFEKRLVG